MKGITEHFWSEESFAWKDLSDAINYIGIWLRHWPRISVVQMKEKFGTARIYCSFGWDCFHTIFYPGYCWIHKWWPYKLDLWLSYNTPILKWLNTLIIPIQKKAYIWRYKKAVQKWPHLYEEILGMADYGELFEGVIPEYKHSDYWTEVGK